MASTTVTAADGLSGVEAPYVIQRATGNAQWGASVSTYTCPAVTSVGSTLLACIELRTNALSASVTSVTDDGGNAWTRLTNASNVGTSNDVDLWVCLDATFANTVGVTVNANIRCAFLVTIFEIGGIEPRSVDVTGNAHGNSQPGSLTCSATSGAPELGVCYYVWANGTSSVSAGSLTGGWLNGDQEEVGGGQIATGVTYTQTWDSVATPSFSASLNPSISWIVSIVTFSMGPIADRALQSPSRTSTDTLSSFGDTPVRSLNPATRSASTSLGGLTDSPSRSQSSSRAPTDTLGALSDTATRNATRPTRSPSDALGSFSETMANNTSASRSATTALSAFTETLARSLSIIRTGSDTLTSITDSATRALAASMRSGADTLSAFSEFIGRAGRTQVSAVDSLNSVVDTPASNTAASSTVSDVLDSLSEALSAAVQSLRSGADALTNFSESVSSKTRANASTTETLSAITDIATRALNNARISLEDVLDAFADTAIVQTFRAALVTAVDALSGLVEQVDRFTQANPAAVDVLNSFGETVSRLAQASLRGTADSLSQIIGTVTVLTTRTYGTIRRIISRGSW